MLGVWGGAGAGGEAKGEDEEDAGNCADGAEYACAFEASEEAAYNCPGKGAGAGDEVLDIDAEEAQGDDENSGEGAGQGPDDGNRGGGTRDLDGAINDEAKDGAQDGARNGAAQGPEEEAANEPHEALAGCDSQEAKAAESGAGSGG